MDDSQLPLFDWPTSVMGMGYRNLAAFKFEEAEQDFRDVHFSGQGNETEITKALNACKYWQPLVNQSKTDPENLPPDKLYKEFRCFDFENIPGLHQLAESLLRHIADRMSSEGHFYINENDKTGKTVSDLLMELGQFNKAELTVLQKSKDQPNEFQLHYILAHIQWIIHLKGEAKKNYARALLGDPCRIPPHRILPEQLRSLIHEVGAEMAPAFGWVRGVLPLVSPPKNPEFCSKSHRKAYYCYRLLWLADKAVQNDNIENRISYRKKLKADAPNLYDEYFALLSGRANGGRI